MLETVINNFCGRNWCLWRSDRRIFTICDTEARAIVVYFLNTLTFFRLFPCGLPDPKNEWMAAGAWVHGTSCIWPRAGATWSDLYEKAKSYRIRYTESAASLRTTLPEPAWRKNGHNLKIATRLPWSIQFSPNSYYDNKSISLVRADQNKGGKTYSLCLYEFQLPQ